MHFNNIGIWGKQVVQRSAITEFCQYCNSITTAGYWHAFKDGQGMPLNGSNQRGYMLTFRKGQVPTAQRFWSVTASTPQAIELIPIGHISARSRAIRPGFNLMLRIYGTTDSAQNVCSACDHRGRLGVTSHGGARSFTVVLAGRLELDPSAFGQRLRGSLLQTTRCMIR